MKIFISIIGLLIFTCTYVYALECIKAPEQIKKDWEVEVNAAILRIGPVKGAELKTKTKKAAEDLLGKLPDAGKIYLEQMMFSAYCSALRDDKTISESEKAKLLKEYRKDVMPSVRQLRLNINWPEVLNQLKTVEEKARGEAFMSRTFSLSREPGASITLGNCPSDQCMKFTLGSLTRKAGVWIQEIILEGDGFGIKKRPNTEYLIALDNAVRLKGAALSLPFGDRPAAIMFKLHKDSEFEMFTPYADLKFSVVDLSIETLRIRLDAKPPSGFSLD